MGRDVKSTPTAYHMVDIRQIVQLNVIYHTTSATIHVVMVVGVAVKAVAMAIYCNLFNLTQIAEQIEVAVYGCKGNFRVLQADLPIYPISIGVVHRILYGM